MGAQVIMRWGLWATCALTLAGCSENRSLHDPNICGPMDQRKLEIPTDFASQYGVTRECVEHWAARLSRSKEPVTVVVDASVYACEEAFSELTRFAGQEGQADALGALVVGMRKQAYFRVVQWRAGNCDIK